MPRELPGLYWDHVRHRYFPRRQSQPLSVSVATPLTPPQNQPALEQTLPTPVSIAIKRRRSQLPVYRALSDLRSALSTAHKNALIHHVQSSQILLTDKATRSVVHPERLLSAFQIIYHSGRVWSFAGDTLGWFYSSIVDEDREQTDTIDGWQCQFYLSSEISSIGVSGTTCVATSFGPECRILYLPLATSLDQAVHVSRIDSRVVHDVWTTDLQGSRLVLGANKQVVVIEDIAVCTSLQRLPTKSDVFALAQCENLLYAGLRNGGILRFDSRVQDSSTYCLFDSLFHRTTSVTGLKHLHNHQLLVSHIDGSISTFDLRFPIRTPLVTFTGNINSYTTRLPLATDPYEKFLFAAGQDNRIRVWSLITGGSALHVGGADSTNQTLLQRPFEHRIAALQVIEEKKGICLWAACGSELCKYSLGHCSGIGIQARSFGG